MIDRFDGKYRFLSNFSPAQVEFEGLTYPSVEHAYQSAKTTELEIRKHFADSQISAGFAKKMGKCIELRPDWNEVKDSVMETLLRKKFNPPNLRTMLLSTGSESLVEGNTWGDTYWGVCRGVGQNKLGILLEKIREELRNG
jgi:ribA/ribD-fused uncharacterized protein